MNQMQTSARDSRDCSPSKSAALARSGSDSAVGLFATPAGREIESEGSLRIGTSRLVYIQSMLPATVNANRCNIPLDPSETSHPATRVIRPQLRYR